MPTETRPGADRTWLHLIAVFKFAETAAVVLLALATAKLLDLPEETTDSHWSKLLAATREQRFVADALDRIDALSANQTAALAVAAGLLALLFFAEGIGLWLGRRWAEWLSVLATSVFVPLEILEVVRRASPPKVVTLIVNVAVVAYLVWRIVRHGRSPVAR